MQTSTYLVIPPILCLDLLTRPFKNIYRCRTTALGQVKSPKGMVLHDSVSLPSICNEMPVTSKAFSTALNLPVHYLTLLLGLH